MAILLLDRSADANVYQDEQARLKLASSNGYAVLVMVKHLLASGADVDDTALHASVVANGRHNEAFNEIVRTLLHSSANANAVNSTRPTFGLRRNIRI